MGRRIPSLNANALYFDPDNGRPTQWASIPPEKTESFAYTCYALSSGLLQPNLQYKDVGNFYGWPYAGWKGEINVAESLEEVAMWAYARASNVPTCF